MKEGVCGFKCGGRCVGVGCPGWWLALPAGERALIRGMMRMLKGAKRSGVQDVASAARKWEAGLGFFLKVRLVEECQRGRGWRELSVNSEQ
jgi:hypothetical protein